MLVKKVVKKKKICQVCGYILRSKSLRIAVCLLASLVYRCISVRYFCEVAINKKRLSLHLQDSLLYGKYRSLVF